MRLSVVVRAREDGATASELVALAGTADRLGYPELWIGEGPTWDAFVLATAVGMNTRSAAITVGPVPVSVRDPATISRGAASVSSVIGRPVGVALGTSSVRVVEKLHGRSRRTPVADLEMSARELRRLIDEPADQRYTGDPDAAFLGRLTVPDGPLTVAAFGDRAIAIAAAYADRLLLDLVTPDQVARLRKKLDEASRGNPPAIAAWLPVAVDPSPDARDQIRITIAGYLTVAGYREMFIEAGFLKAVDLATRTSDLKRRAAALPDGAEEAVGLVGSAAEIGSRLEEYSAAGLDEVAVVPATASDAGAETTLAALSAFL